MKKNHKIITCALPYINNDLHLGHIYSTHLPADILARFFRLQKYNVIFFSGNDCHGIPIIKSMKQQNLSFYNLSKKYIKLNTQIYKKFEISYDFFLNTKNSKHKNLVRKYIKKMIKNNDIQIIDNKIFLCKNCNLSTNEKICNICHKNNLEMNIKDYKLTSINKNLHNKFLLHFQKIVPNFFKKKINNIELLNNEKIITRIIPIGVKIPLISNRYNNLYKQKIYV